MMFASSPGRFSSRKAIIISKTFLSIKDIPALNDFEDVGAILVRFNCYSQDEVVFEKLVVDFGEVLDFIFRIKHV